MKQVITDTHPFRTTVRLKDTTPRKFYGVEYGTRRRAMLTQSSYRSGMYMWLCVSNFNDGNLAFSKTSSFDTAFKNPADYFEFDTAHELLLWAADSMVDSNF